MAIQEGDLQRCRALVLAGADLAATDIAGRTPLHVAVDPAGNRGTSSYQGRGMRIPFRHGEAILHIAARRNWTVLCRWLLRLGADVNATDIRDMTPLHHTVRFGAMETARLLIARGADVNAKDWQGRTPPDLAETGGGVAVAGTIHEEISARHERHVKAVKVLRDHKRNGCAQE